MAPVIALALAACTPPPPDLIGPGNPARGEVVAALAGGCGCHTPENGPVGAGGVEIETPFGLFYSTNITGDAKAGIGSWSDEELEGAIRRGILRDGSVEAPVMPYHLYSGMSDGDVRDLIAWMRRLPPAEKENRPHEVWLPFSRLAFWGWRTLFAPEYEPPIRGPLEGPSRGRYLTDHVSICGDCHTPRDIFGAPEASMYLAGARDGPLGDVPNITPDDATGVGKWDEYDMVALLQDGMLPDMDNVQGKMADVCDGIADGPGYYAAPEEDLQAISAYLRTVPPIKHEVD